MRVTPLLGGTEGRGLSNGKIGSFVPFFIDNHIPSIKDYILIYNKLKGVKGKKGRV